MIRYSGFGKRFGPVDAVRDLDLAVGEGETLALIGPNGSGKTTCLKAAVGLVRPSSGEVRVLGLDPFLRPAARERLGYLPQRLGFPEAATGLDVMRFHARLRRAPSTAVGELLERFGLDAAADRRTDTFSGGMRQRLGLAVAMLGDPGALILDEPSAALDPSASLAVRDALRDLGDEGRTIAFASHDLAEVGALADRVAVFDGGELRALGTPRVLAGELGLPMRLRLDAPGVVPAAAEAARRAGAQGVVMTAEGISCEIPPGREGAVLEALRVLGVPLEALSVVEPGVEDIYRALLKPAPRLVA
ncbi:MAG TPA: ABC transporter ATP-binding protein [Longimicrobiales bacterium]|nr:ABC transporter ATP-binding protein [Longimicrobiales bacterium]